MWNLFTIDYKYTSICHVHYFHYCGTTILLDFVWFILEQINSYRRLCDDHSYFVRYVYLYVPCACMVQAWTMPGPVAAYSRALMVRIGMLFLDWLWFYKPLRDAYIYLHPCIPSLIYYSMQSQLLSYFTISGARKKRLLIFVLRRIVKWSQLKRYESNLM
jgi:hypothetical protein